MKEIVLEIGWYSVVMNDGTRFFLVLERTFEEVERTIVLVVEQVLHVLLK